MILLILSETIWKQYQNFTLKFKQFHRIIFVTEKVISLELNIENDKDRSISIFQH